MPEALKNAENVTLILKVGNVDAKISTVHTRDPGRQCQSRRPTSSDLRGGISTGKAGCIPAQHGGCLHLANGAWA